MDYTSEDNNVLSFDWRGVIDSTANLRQATLLPFGALADVELTIGEGGVIHITSDDENFNDYIRTTASFVSTAS
jgi:hypothetical protein